MKETTEQKKALKQKIRKEIRAERSLFSNQAQSRAAKQALKLILRTPFFRFAKRIAFYWPHGGELDPRPILDEALKMKKKCYLPVVPILPHKKLMFARYTSKTRLKLNRFGIPEPESHSAETVSPHSLSLVFVPLVAFDDQGHRLGMGGGYYDATFFPIKKRLQSKPVLIGVGYSWQEKETIPQEEWDLKLDCILTERKFGVFGKKNQ